MSWKTRRRPCLKSLRCCIHRLPRYSDPRHRRGRVHPLPGVLGLSVLGLMAGCRSLSDISRWGALHPEVHGSLGLRRSPSVATLGRVLRWVSVSEVRDALRNFTQQLVEGRGLGGPITLAADGKTAKGVWEGGHQLCVVHMFAHEARLALDQVQATSHLNEVSVAKSWMEQVATQFPGLAVLTGDALYADRTLCEAIVAQGQDYLIKLKKTNRTSLTT